MLTLIRFILVSFLRKYREGINKGDQFHMLLLRTHITFVVAESFYNFTRGNLDVGDDTADLREIVDKNWHRDMGVEAKTIEQDITSIQDAHDQFFEFADNLVGAFEHAAETNQPLEPEQLTAWNEKLESMVMDHRRNADHHELEMMRSLRVVTGMTGLLRGNICQE